MLFYIFCRPHVWKGHGVCYLGREQCMCSTIRIEKLIYVSRARREGWGARTWTGSAQ
jgi:hypothetical protein